MEIYRFGWKSPGTGKIQKEQEVEIYSMEITLNAMEDVFKTPLLQDGELLQTFPPSGIGLYNMS